MLCIVVLAVHVSLSLSQTINASTTPAPRTADVSADILLLIGLCILAIAWLLFLTFGMSRVLGLLLTQILQRFLCKDRQSFCSVGSISICMLSGMVVFRDLRYISKAFGLTAVDGLIQIRCVNALASVFGFDIAHLYAATGLHSMTSQQWRLRIVAFSSNSTA